LNEFLDAPALFALDLQEVALGSSPLAVLGERQTFVFAKSLTVFIVRPEFLTNSQQPEGLAPIRGWALAYAVATAAAVFAISFAPRDIAAVPRLLGMVGLSLLALVVSGTDCLRWLVASTRAAFNRIPRIGHFVGLSILARPFGAGISMVAIASVFAFAVVLVTVVESTIASMDEWLALRAGGSATIFAGGPNSGLGGEPISPSVLAAIESTPGVDGLSIFYTTSLVINGRETPVHAVSSEVALRHHGFYPNDTPPDVLVAALRRGEVAMSYAFGHFFSKQIGDTITLPTREGSRSFRIGGVIRNYAGPTGTLMLDIGTFDLWFARDGATQARIWSTRPYSEVQRSIEARVGDAQPLFFRYDEEQTGIALRNFQRFRALLYVIIGIAALFCGAALLNLLTSSVTTRQRDLAIMQTVGAKPFEIALSVVVDALVLSVVGAAAGIFIGALTGRVLCDFFFQRLGWFIDYRVDPFTILAPVGALHSVDAFDAHRAGAVAHAQEGGFPGGLVDAFEHRQRGGCRDSRTVYR
jgi:putative ABC transport system permease protein